MKVKFIINGIEGETDLNELKEDLVVFLRNGLKVEILPI